MNKKASFIIPTVIIKEAKLGSISRFLKGLATGPEDVLRYMSGHDLQNVSHLGRAGKIGNITGGMATSGATLYGTQQLLNRALGGDKKGKESGGNPGNYDSFAPHAKYENKMWQAVKNNKSVDSIVPDLNSMPSGFQNNELLKLMRDS
jgi:hypothetical protein